MATATQRKYLFDIYNSIQNAKDPKSESALREKLSIAIEMLHDNFDVFSSKKDSNRVNDAFNYRNKLYYI